MTAPRLLRVSEAAERLGLKPHTLRLWLAARRLPIVRLGRAVRVPEQAVEDFISSNTVPARDGGR
jgi:excisionase family DNA binding protein